MRNNFALMTAVAERTRLAPPNRIARLMNFRKKINDMQEAGKVLEEANMSLNNELVTLKGRVLPPQTLFFVNNPNHQGVQMETMGDDKLWDRSLKTLSQFSTVPLKNWFVVYSKNYENEVNQFMQTLKSQFSDLKYDYTAPKLVVSENDTIIKFRMALQKVINCDPTLIMIIVPNTRSDMYSEIKRLCCVEYAIPTQVVVRKTIDPTKIAKVKSVAHKVAVQINCKLGGVPWRIHVPIGGLMVIGYDVYHDARDKSRSFGAFVATMDLKQSTEIYCSATPHTNGEELSRNININLENALRQYRSKHNSYPQKIMFYRDGVGDGQVSCFGNFIIFLKYLPILYFSCSLNM